MWTDPDFRRFLFDDQIMPPSFVADEIAGSQARFVLGLPGLWAIVRHTAPEIVGMCGFRFFYDPPELQLIYGIAPAQWGQGLATEAVRAVIEVVFADYGFDEVIAAADAPNEASLAVMQRAGMRYHKRAVKDGIDTVYYRIGRDDAQAAREPERD